LACHCQDAGGFLLLQPGCSSRIISPVRFLVFDLARFLIDVTGWADQREEEGCGVNKRGKFCFVLFGSVDRVGDPWLERETGGLVGGGSGIGRFQNGLRTTEIPDGAIRLELPDVATAAGGEFPAAFDAMNPLIFDGVCANFKLEEFILIEILYRQA
jgi:hypothetical protein